MADPPEVNFDNSAAVCDDILDRIEEAVVVEREVLREVLAAVVARGHVLLEDVPGTGKSVMARVLAESLGLGFNRLQFTPDLLPADVTGSNVYNEHERTFEFAEGPVFTNVVLADEINRAPPKTQAALLEAMEERQVSVDGTTHQLPEPFFVIATQNPVEQEGTFRLPEAQRDRFSVKTSIGYPDTDGEMGLLERRSNRRTLSPSVDPVVDRDTVEALQELAEDVQVERKVRRYIIDIATATRRDGRTDIGVSPRGVQRVFELARALAVIEGRDYVTPDDVKRLALPAMTHRVVLTTEATVEGVEPAAVVRNALDRIDVPAVSPDAADDEPPQPPEGASGPHRQSDTEGQPGRRPDESDDQPERGGSAPPREGQTGQGRDGQAGQGREGQAGHRQDDQLGRGTAGQPTQRDGPAGQDPAGGRRGDGQHQERTGRPQGDEPPRREGQPRRNEQPRQGDQPRQEGQPRREEEPGGEGRPPREGEPAGRDEDERREG